MKQLEQPDIFFQEKKKYKDLAIIYVINFK